ncbi:trichohyalin-like [Salmo trutta]|uniref:trichohyalin-like n=1 Tax=Salmo trutta TaxID=8032 RepID=UPI00112FD360|nr:trichohyalin-like [Salmo trutta]
MGASWRITSQKLLLEFRTLYHEHLRHIDQSDDSQEEALQSKVGMLQLFVRDLSEQNEVLIQALEAEEAEDRVVEGRTVSLHKELEGSTTDSTGSSPVPHLTEQRGRELLKTELSRWDATIQRLQRDVLLSHQARDSQSAQLDVHGQRISQLQTELQERQLELQRGHSRREQQQRDLQTQTQQAEELHTQLAEVKGRLVQVEGENVALMGYKLELRAEAKEQTQKFQDTVSSLKSQHGCVSQQLQDRSAEVQRLQRSLAELHGREMEWERETSALQGQLGLAREELHSAILRRQAQQQKEELFGELQREVDRLKNERQEMRKKLCGREEELKRLRDEQHQLKDKVRESDVQAVWLQSQADVVGRELWEESAQRDRELWEWRDRYHAVSEGLRLREAGLEEVQRARDTALRSLRLQEEKTHSLGAQRQEMQHSLEGLQDRLAQKEEMVVALRVKLQDHEEDARVLRQQLLSSQDALQQVTAELRSCKREREKQDSQCVETEERLAEIRADLVQLQQQYTTCYAQLVQEEAGVGRLREELRPEP